MLMLFFFLFEGLESYFINLHGVVLLQGCQWLGWHCRFVLAMVQNSFVFLMLVHDAFIVDIQKAYYHTEQFVQ
jgi:hypothetical protein